MDTVTGLLTIEIPREFLENGGEYVLTAVTENGRTAETAFIFQDGQIVDVLLDENQGAPEEDTTTPV